MRVISFVLVFILGFFLGGWFLMPHLPPVPTHPVSALELEYWKGNWAGAILGLILAAASARSARKAGRGNDQPDASIAAGPLNPPRV